MMYGTGYGAGGWIVMTIMMVVFWGALIFAIAAAVRYGFGSHHGGSTRKGRGAEQVLADRFARGEIDEDDFRQRLATIRDAHGSRSR